MTRNQNKIKMNTVKDNCKKKCSKQKYARKLVKTRFKTTKKWVNSGEDITDTFSGIQERKYYKDDIYEKNTEFDFQSQSFRAKDP